MANTLVCALCQQEVVSKVVNEQDLGGVLIEFANHCNLQHNSEYHKYASNLGMLLQVMPAYLMIEHLVDYETTCALDNNTFRLIKQCQKIVNDVLGVGIELAGIVSEGELVSNEETS